MTLHAALAAAATLLALAFALSTLDRWAARRRPHELMWTISLFLFALGSLGLWAGAALGWSEWTFKAFYLFGAILNVPFLALGTVYLLADRRTGDRSTAVVSLLAAFASGIVVAAPVTGTIDARVLPQGSAVFGAGPRIMAATASGIAAVVIVIGAAWSAWRLWRGRPSRPSRPSPDTPVRPGRLAIANVLIAIGTIVLGSGGVLNSVADAMDAFAISLVLGIALIFSGFLLTNSPAPLEPVEPWHLPIELRDARPDDRSGHLSDDRSGQVSDDRAEDRPDDRAPRPEDRREDRHDLPRSEPRPGSPSLN
jgi:hypothetical protein